MKAWIERFLRDEQGLETVEYAVMAALIIIGTVVAVGALATAVSMKFDSVSNGPLK